MVETSRLISEAVRRKERSSVRAGLVAGVLAAGVVEGVGEVPGGFGVVLEMDFMEPVVGMERAMAKNSAVRSVMVAMCLDYLLDIL